MLELNLLPKNMRGLKARKLKFASRMKYVKLGSVLIVISFGVVFFILMLFAQTHRSKVSRLEGEQANLAPRMTELESLEDEVEEIKKKLSVLETIVEQHVQFSEILEGLSRSTLENVWFTSFEARRGRSSSDFQRSRGRTDDSGSLTLRGYVLGESEDATSQVAQLVTSLTNESLFSQFFKDIELENVQSDEIEGKHTMNFVIKCDFRGEVTDGQ